MWGYLWAGGGSGRGGLEFVDKRSEDGVGYRWSGGRVVAGRRVGEGDMNVRLVFCLGVVAFC